MGGGGPGFLNIPKCVFLALKTITGLGNIPKIYQFFCTHPQYKKVLVFFAHQTSNGTTIITDRLYKKYHYSVLWKWLNTYFCKVLYLIVSSAIPNSENFLSCFGWSFFPLHCIKVQNLQVCSISKTKLSGARTNKLLGARTNT